MRRPGRTGGAGADPARTGKPRGRRMGARRSGSACGAARAGQRRRSGDPRRRRGQRPDPAGFHAGNVAGTRGCDRARRGKRASRGSSMSPRSPRASRSLSDYGASKAPGRRGGPGQRARLDDRPPAGGLRPARHRDARAVQGRALGRRADAASGASVDHPRATISPACCWRCGCRADSAARIFEPDDGKRRRLEPFGAGACDWRGGGQARLVAKCAAFATAGCGADRPGSSRQGGQADTGPGALYGASQLGKRA